MSSAPHIRDVKPNSSEFREALAKAGIILAGDTDFSVYSHHTHFPFKAGEVMFEEAVTEGELALYPMSEEEAQTIGLPSCWAITADGAIVVMRYASRTLHERSGVDVMSDEFKAKLATIGQAFAAAGLHKTVELNIAGKLFPHGEGLVTHEETDEKVRQQRVTVIPIPADLAAGDWTFGACWSFNSQHEAVVTGMCNRNGATVLHT